MTARPFHILAAVLAAGASVILLLRLLVVAVAQPLSPIPTDPITPQFEDLLPADSINDLDVILYLRQSVDLEDLSRISDEVARRRELVSRLQTIAGDTQAPVIDELDRLLLAGLVRHYRPLWIVNAVAATLSQEAVDALTSLPAVERIEPDRQHNAFDEPSEYRTVGDSSFDFAGWASAPDARPGEAANWSIARTRAPYAWNLLGTDGESVTVAIVDTGVDWRHPALRDSYRGGRGEATQHAGNWFNAVQPTQTIPIDLHGHGTHVAGTAVGGLGIGVAPGAKWIAVAIADENGRIRDSDIHAAFQWLLAPDGKPELAPDVVNNSWGTSGDYLAFRDDVRALLAAGIVPVFAAGNTGPNAGTINAPASYPGAISVAAEDNTGGVAWFSSRGPSPLTQEVKPLLSAPGAQILSAYPNNRYALFNGTSMAAPHVTGAIALMLSAEPRLSEADIAARLAASAGTLHNPASGWGSLDVYDLAAPLLSTAHLQGRVTSPTGPLAGAVVTLTTPSGAETTFTTDAEGTYKASVIEGLYNLQAAAFGYAAGGIAGIDALSGHVIATNIVLNPLPTGTISVNTVQSETGHPVDGLLSLISEGRAIPYLPARQPDGRLAFDLPEGRYTIEARAAGYRLQIIQVDIRVGTQQHIDIELEPGPRLLLVDSGPWQYSSQAIYYDEALRDLGYFADHWSIADPYAALPTIEHLARYDAVIWSAPFDSPGSLNANNVITGFLGIGGRLLITGQNVGNYDGAQGSAAIWWARNLEARWVSDVPPELELVGVAATPFAGLVLSLNGKDSAQNQITPDQVAPLGRSLTQPVLLYEDGTVAALSAARCRPFRLVYLGFGLEGVTGGPQRAALMKAGLDALLTPGPERHALWQPAQVSDFALGGDQPAYTATLRNLSRTLTRTFQIDTTGGEWSRSILTPTLTIEPCGSADTVVTLEVPTVLPREQWHEMSVTAVADGESSAISAAILTVTHKTPGSILLVDDDRFFNAESVYSDALNQLGLIYDTWETGWQNEVRGSPRAEFLQAYDLVIWFTGYDWYEPINSAENEALVAFLENGGRLFLSSQDLLWANRALATPRDYLGVAAYQESITPTHVFADERVGLPPALAGPLPLEYGVYQNYSDGLIPTSEAIPFLWHNQGSPASTATSGIGATGLPWRVVFWAIPFETLPGETRALALQSIIDQLSDIGDSRFTVDRRNDQAPEPRVYNLVVINSDVEARQIWVTNTLPVSLTLQDASSGFVYDRNRHQLHWEGVLEPGENRILHYTARIAPSLRSGERIENHVALSSAPLYTDKPNLFDYLVVTRTATTWIGAPDLSGSSLSAQGAVVPNTSTDEDQGPVQLITYSLVMRNTGFAPTGPMSATVSMPRSLGVLEDSLIATAGTVHVEGWRMVWEGKVLPGETVTASLALTETAGVNQVYPTTAYIYDQVTDPVLRPLFFTPLPHRAYSPFIGAWP